MCDNWSFKLSPCVVSLLNLKVQVRRHSIWDTLDVRNTVSDNLNGYFFVMKVVVSLDQRPLASRRCTWPSAHSWPWRGPWLKQGLESWERTRRTGSCSVSPWNAAFCFVVDTNAAPLAVAQLVERPYKGPSRKCNSDWHGLKSQQWHKVVGKKF